MKPWLNINTHGLWINLGWYKGESFKVLAIGILETSGEGMTTIFQIQVAHFCFGFGVST